MNPRIVVCEVKQPVYNYSNTVLRLDCFPELLTVSLKTSQPTKEYSTSLSQIIGGLYVHSTIC